MGSPHFAVPSLDAIIGAGYNIVGVITSPDKPAGRGRQLIQSPVKRFALQTQIPLLLLQPDKLKDPAFVEQLKTLNADLQIVVAFRMLPEVIWGMPTLGTINLHASLLPQYRGAAPINWAIINGETETGLTTFFINHEIDTGKIIYQEKVSVEPDETAGELHDRLKIIGAQLLLKTIESIRQGEYRLIEQNSLIKSGEIIKKAPKINTEDCKINWDDKAENIYNFIRGLSPLPGAWSEWKSRDGEKLFLKIYSCETEITQHRLTPGTFDTDKKNFIKIAVADGFIKVKELQQAGKKRMSVQEFLKGFRTIQSYRIR